MKFRNRFFFSLSKMTAFWFAAVMFCISLNAQSLQKIDYDTVKAQRFDTGKMWSFDYPPIDYFKEAYGFDTDQQWYDDVRLSALRVVGCTASFVSGDGLIMTNWHCIVETNVYKRIEKEGEDLETTGFLAKTLGEERKIPNYYADQLVLIKDVTDTVLAAGSVGATDEEKTKNKNEKIKQLEEKYNKETGLNCKVVSLFNGAKYSIYGYKRYTDVRLVYFPERAIGYFGGDFDNFTYPRYNLDCGLMRIYDDDGKPLKTDHFFKFSTKGIKEGEPIFTVGNPGFTQRLASVAQLEYARDITYRNLSYLFDTYYDDLEALKSIDPANANKYEDIKVSIGNAQKVFHNTYRGLIDPYLMARKKAFEKTLQEKVFNDPELNKQYGHVWKAIENTRAELRKIGPKIAAFGINRRFAPEYFFIAQGLYNLAEELQKPEDERLPEYKGEKLDSVINSIFPADFNKLLEDTKLKVQAGYIEMNLGNDDPLVKKMFGGLSGDAAVKFALAHSKITSKEDVVDLAEEGADAILNSDDPFIEFVKVSNEQLSDLQKEAKEVSSTEAVYNDMLGQIVFKVYGTTIPPDANFTLRISDGVLKSFDYNGTKAPLHTTFYGLYNRYYSFDKQYPWTLPDKWLNIPSDFDLSTPLDFISTNDIVGGNSGSPIINKDKEVVGLAFDGNIDSIIGNFIYNPINNRCVAVDVRSILAAFDKVYKAQRLYYELLNGKMME